MRMYQSLCRLRRGLFAAIGSACLAVAGPAFAREAEPVETEATTDAAADSAEPLLRGGRYCEVMIVRSSGGKNVAEVWSTQGVSGCPENCEAAFDAGDIKSETKAQRVVINGPRIWLPSSPAPTPPADARRRFGGIELGRVATFEVKRGAGDPFKERVVPRTTANTFKKGDEIYELTSPEGVVYVMQSMSLSEEPELTMGDLATLGSRLRLPKGWKYTARVLEADLSLAPSQENEVVVLQDRLKNTYQRR